MKRTKSKPPKPLVLHVDITLEEILADLNFGR
jgi:hypothetical protein